MKKQDQRAEHARQAREKRKAKQSQPTSVSQEPIPDKQARGPLQAHSPQRKPLAGRLLRRAGAALLASMTLIGGTYVLYDLRPKVQVSEGISLDKEDPLKTQFAVANRGVFALRRAEVICHITSLKTQGGGVFRDITVFDSKHKITSLGTLAPGESTTAPCRFTELVKLPPVREADMDFDITFGYFLWWKPILVKFRFVTQADKNGELHWFPRPLSQ